MSCAASKPTRSCAGRPGGRSLKRGWKAADGDDQARSIAEAGSHDQRPGEREARDVGVAQARVDAQRLLAELVAAHDVHQQLDQLRHVAPGARRKEHLEPADSTTRLSCGWAPPRATASSICRTRPRFTVMIGGVLHPI